MMKIDGMKTLIVTNSYHDTSSLCVSFLCLDVGGKKTDNYPLSLTPRCLYHVPVSHSPLHFPVVCVRSPDKSWKLLLTFDLSPSTICHQAITNKSSQSQLWHSQLFPTNCKTHIYFTTRPFSWIVSRHYIIPSSLMSRLTIKWENTHLH